MGRFRHGACSTEPKRACGASRRVTLTAGVTMPVVGEVIGMLRKVLSESEAILKLNPRKLLARKVALRTSEVTASPKESAKARRKVREESSLTSATKRQPSGRRD